MVGASERDLLDQKAMFIILLRDCNAILFSKKTQVVGGQPLPHSIVI